MNFQFSDRSSAIDILPAPVEAIVCTACKGDVEMIQPDCDEPFRLLAICQDCQEWSVVYITLTPLGSRSRIQRI